MNFIAMQRKKLNKLNGNYWHKETCTKTINLQVNSFHENVQKQCSEALAQNDMCPPNTFKSTTYSRTKFCMRTMRNGFQNGFECTPFEEEWPIWFALLSHPLTTPSKKWPSTKEHWKPWTSSQQTHKAKDFLNKIKNWWKWQCAHEGKSGKRVENSHIEWLQLQFPSAMPPPCTPTTQDFNTP